jgi:hypothetical protein
MHSAATRILNIVARRSYVPGFIQNQARSVVNICVVCRIWGYDNGVDVDLGLWDVTPCHLVNSLVLRRV